MHTLNGGSWVSVGEGCPLRCVASGSGEGYLLIGEAPHQYELTFEVEALRELVAKGTAALAQMDTWAEQEEAQEPAMADAAAEQST
jgi:hypothetical protein